TRAEKFLADFKSGGPFESEDFIAVTRFSGVHRANERIYELRLKPSSRSLPLPRPISEALGATGPEITIDINRDPKPLKSLQTHMLGEVDLEANLTSKTEAVFEYD